MNTETTMRKTTYILGILAGVCTMLTCATGHETAQYILSFVCLAAFWLNDRASDKEKNIRDYTDRH